MGRRPLPVRTALLIALAAGLAPGAGLAAPETRAFCGYGYGLEDNAYRYTEVHRQLYDGARWLGGTITYIAADGSTIGRKTLSFEASPTIPVYRLELFDGQYIEGIEAVAPGKVSAFRKDFDEKEMNREDLAYKMPAAADSGFHALIQSSLADILQGTRPFTFIVAGALDQYRFRVRKTGKAMFEGRPAVRLVAEPDSLLRLLVDPLDLTYDPASGELLEYRGPTNLRDRTTGDGYDVRIVFASAIPDDAPAAAVLACADDVK